MQTNGYFVEISYMTVFELRCFCYHVRHSNPGVCPEAMACAVCPNVEG
jgi:hypothetical protein